jgi:predicted Zn-dependent peptidase
MADFQRIVLENGIRLLVEEVAEASSVSAGVTLVGGSRREPVELSGITHFVEHMLFKGTRRRDLHGLAREINLQGGGLDAYTCHESLRLYSRVVPEDLSDLLVLLAEMFFESTFPESEVERERGVILEEIAESRDNPEDLCFDLFLEALWAPDALGRSILGVPETVGAFDRARLAGYWEERLDPADVIISMAGAINAAEAVRLVEKAFPMSTRGSHMVAPPVAARPRSRRSVVERDTEQVQFCLGHPALAAKDERRFALGLLNLVLGGGMGSRLFNEIRERRGLAYTIGSAYHSFQTEGYLVIYGGTTAANCEEVIGLCREEVARIAEKGPTPEELNVAKRQVLRGFLLAYESIGYRASRNADREMQGEERLGPKEVAERIREVTLEDVAQLAGDLFERTEEAVAMVGPTGAAEVTLSAG